ncbi:hypothetical protein GQ600_126 [Phytophthora cactorum]|nr:hypothetical protein GQ600_126 [Phytophthora cactorum]
MRLLRHYTYLSSEAITFFSAAYAGCTTDGTLFSLFGRNVTLKKKNVDAHAGRCSNCWDASCVDCSVVFKGNDYAAEMSLLQGDKNESKIGKKETPQERWMDVVQSATCPEDRSLQDVLTRIVGYDNVPRTKNKFLNFVTNSPAMRDTTLVEKAWTIYEMALKASAPESNEATPLLWKESPISQLYVGKLVGFAPAKEPWLSSRLFDDAGSTYIIGRVCRFDKKKALFQVNWLDSQFQKGDKWISMSLVQ